MTIFRVTEGREGMPALGVRTRLAWCGLLLPRFTKIPEDVFAPRA